MGDLKTLKTPGWDRFIAECLQGKAILFYDGQPDKVILACTFPGAKKASKILKTMKVRNWVVVALDGRGRRVALMAMAMLVGDFPGARVFTEDERVLQDGTFVSMSQKPDSETLMALIEDLRCG